MTFLETLRSQGFRYDLLASQCRVTETPIFLDLCWGKDLDFTTIANDPGVEIDRGSRRFVLMRIGGDIRYFAGASDPYNSEAESEFGIFPSMSSALEFGYDYLIENHEISEISAERNPR